MQNQAAVEALYSATLVEDYIDIVENLPNELQRHLSELRELDLRLHRVRTVVPARDRVFLGGDDSNSLVHLR